MACGGLRLYGGRLLRRGLLGSGGRGGLLGGCGLGLCCSVLLLLMAAVAVVVVGGVAVGGDSSCHLV